MNILLVLFYLSGCCGLIYQIAWTRQLTLVFGLSAYAVITVLAAFMGGLALGSYLFGKYIDANRNPVRFYGIIEIAIGLYAVIFPYILALVKVSAGSMAVSVGHGTVLSLIRMIGSFIVLLPPTILMGATFPVLFRSFSPTPDKTGKISGILYSINTAGAVTGAFLAGFILIKLTGISTTVYSAAAANILIGIISIAISGKYTFKSPELETLRTQTVSGIPQTVNSRLILVAAALSGFTFLAYETLATRTLILILGNSSWAFSTILCCVLTGIVIGGFVGSYFYDRIKKPVNLLAFLHLSSSLFILLSLFQFTWQSGLGEVLLADGQKLAGFIISQFIFTYAAVLLPSTVMGAILPLCLKLYCGNQAQHGKNSGKLYAVNTIGAVAGTVITGIILIPLYGSKYSFLTLIFANILFGVFLVFKSDAAAQIKKLTLAGAGISMLLIIFAVSTYSIGAGRSIPGYTLAYEDEGIGGLVNVFKAPDNTRVLNINNITEVATDGVSMQTFRMMGVIPFLAKPEINSGLVITFGAGIASGTLAELGAKNLECVEINPHITGAAKFFSEENFDVLNSGRLDVIIEDGRNYLLTSSKKYDLISADATHPTGADSWVLFTREFYSLCSDHLADGGIFTQWLPLHGLSQDYLRVILATISNSFPEIHVWFTGMDRNVGHILVVASNSKIDFSLKSAEQTLTLPRIQEFLKPYAIDNPMVFIQHYVGGKKAFSDMLKESRINTDNNAITAFPDKLLTHQDVVNNIEMIISQRTELPHKLSESDRERYNRYHSAYSDFWNGQINLFRDKPFEAMALFTRAFNTNPEDFTLRNVLHTILTNMTKPLLDNVVALESQKKFAEALELLASLEISLPETYRPYSEIGRIFLQTGQTEDARKYLVKATELNADFTSFFNLGIIYIEQDSLTRAEWAFKETVRLNPNVSLGHSNLGYVYHRMNRIGDARSAWEEALKINPDDQLAKNGLAQIGR